MALAGSSKPKLGNLVKLEYARDHGFCRETVTAYEATDEEYSVGSLVGKATGETKYKLVDPSLSDGSEVVVGIVLENKTVPATTDTEITILARGMAIVGNKALVYDKTFTELQKTAAINEIQALNILVRTQV